MSSRYGQPSAHTFWPSCPALFSPLRTRSTTFSGASMGGARAFRWAPAGSGGNRAGGGARRRRHLRSAWPQPNNRYRHRRGLQPHHRR